MALARPRRPIITNVPTRALVRSNVPRINRNHPMAQGMTSFYIPFRSEKDLVTGKVVATNGRITAPAVSTQYGPGLQLGGTNFSGGSNVAGTNLGSTQQLFISNAATMFKIYKLMVNGQEYPWGSNRNASSQTIHCWCPFTDNVVYWDFGNNSGANRITWTMSPAPSTLPIMFLVCRGGTTGSSIFANGAKVANQTTGLTITVNTNVFTTAYNGIDTFNPAENVAIVAHGTWNRQLTDDEIYRLMARPYEVLEFNSIVTAKVSGPSPGAGGLQPATNAVNIRRIVRSIGY